MINQYSSHVLLSLHDIILSRKEKDGQIVEIELNSKTMSMFKLATKGFLLHDRAAHLYTEGKIFFLGVELKEVMSNIDDIIIVYKDGFKESCDRLVQ